MTEDYYDFDDSWTFDENGDLKITTDYMQNIVNRFQCPKDYLSIYYSDRYGSELTDLLGTNYNEEHARFVIKETLDEDDNILTYTIDELDYHLGKLTAYITINGVEVTLTLEEEIE